MNHGQQCNQKKNNNNQLPLQSLTHENEYDYDVGKQDNGLEQTYKMLKDLID